MNFEKFFQLLWVTLITLTGVIVLPVGIFENVSGGSKDMSRQYNKILRYKRAQVVVSSFSTGCTTDHFCIYDVGKLEASQQEKIFLYAQ